jgi:hypothetical protein
MYHNIYHFMQQILFDLFSSLCIPLNYEEYYTYVDISKYVFGWMYLVILLTTQNDNLI